MKYSGVVRSPTKSNIQNEISYESFPNMKQEDIESPTIRKIFKNHGKERELNKSSLDNEKISSPLKASLLDPKQSLVSSKVKQENIKCPYMG